MRGEKVGEDEGKNGRVQVYRWGSVYESDLEADGRVNQDRECVGDVERAGRVGRMEGVKGVRRRGGRENRTVGRKSGRLVDWE